MDYKNIVVKTIQLQFNTSSSRAEQVVDNLATNYAVANALPISDFWASNGAVFKRKFESYFAKAHVAGLNSGHQDLNQQLDVFEKTMISLF
ncbi:hypothetical protein [Vibrio sp. EJY3]|uniref:hypothetical protein n=1 Tax=Vibrio sp. (strain EJY3) TaxID=1116375 RepID=UPI000243BEA5|nr:hypothetical protein [Vibrio sp. EJY3]AEX22260.1 hypothetical protein VEJY3_08860 [Vibrio sp. EJY3]